jgi:glyceraldehyde 3-phosphate dehydrogenase
MARIAINGFGRIGRVAYRVLYERGLHRSVIAVNDLTDAPTLAHLLEYDTNYGRLKTKVDSHVYENKAPYSGAIVVHDHSFYVLSVKDPAELPWDVLDVDVVIESTGRFTNTEGMQKHLSAGAKRVILSAPVDGEGVMTVVKGINDDEFMKAPTMVANASCTTNCITPVASVILKEFGIEKAMMTTIHSYTADQVLQDSPHKDLRRARAAAQNIVPTTTGATKAAGLVIKELEGIFDGLAIRVPTSVGSLSDFTFVTKKHTTKEAVNEALEQASKGKLKGILDYTTKPLVSSDIVGSTASAIVDSSLTQVVGGNLVKVIAWYDNEWGYTNRLIDQVEAMVKTLDHQHRATDANTDSPPAVESTTMES